MQVVVSSSYIVKYFLGVSPLTPFFIDEVWHQNYVSLVISIRHNHFGIISSIHSTSWNFHPNISSTSIYHPKRLLMFIFIQIFHPFCNFHPCTCGSIWHNCFGICFIQTNCLLTFTIQKVHWCSPSSKLFVHFVTFIHVHVTKYFSCHSYVAWGYSKNILFLSS
jgi:hypothetical protein